MLVLLMGMLILDYSLPPKLDYYADNTSQTYTGRITPKQLTSGLSLIIAALKSLEMR